MSIASEITRLQGAKADIKTAIEAKGVTVPSNALIDNYDTYIAQISGGGVTGLEYETGTYKPSEDIARPTISFSKTHTNPPALLSIYDVGDDFPDTNSNVYMNYVDPYRLFGSGYPSNTTPSIRYATVIYSYRGTGTSLNTGTTHCQYNSDTASSGTSYAKYYVDTTGFQPYCSSSTRYWRKDRTYKWIAVWK